MKRIGESKASSEQEIEVRPFLGPQEYAMMIDYFVSAEKSFLRGMGVDPAKLPTRQEWLKQALLDHDRVLADKDRFYLAWMYQGRQVGHSSVNKIKVGEEAFIHLHLWKPELRRAGMGVEFFKRSVNFFMREFRLKRLLCEPYAENSAPNKVLSKLGFRLIKRYRTVPGAINYEQDVNQYELDHGLS